MFNRQLQAAACIVALCMGAGPLAASASPWDEKVAMSRETSPNDQTIKKLRRGFRVLVRLADAGDVGAQAYLAHLYEFGGTAIDRNGDEAWRLYEHLVETLDADSMLELGHDILLGSDGPLKPRVPYAVGTYLWLSLGIARHPEPGSRAQEYAKLRRVHAARRLDAQGIRTAERLYKKLTRNDPQVRRYHAREAQRLLTELGHSPGPVDGQWGPRSQRALDAWLDASGRGSREVDIATLREMRLALADTANQGHSLARFVCQQFSANSKLLDRVVIVEQLSVQLIDYPDEPPLDGSDLLDPGGRTYTRQVPARMRIFNDVSLVSDTKPKEEIIDELLRAKASLNSDGDRMDFRGRASRFKSRFSFDAQKPYVKSFFIDLEDPTNIWVNTNNGAGIMPEDGNYRCEDPVLVAR